MRIWYYRVNEGYAVLAAAKRAILHVEDSHGRKAERSAKQTTAF